MTEQSEGEVVEAAAPESPSEVASFRALGFFPADHAAAESGKVYAAGSYWNVLRFPAFPAVLRSLTLVAVLEQPFHAAHADHVFEMGLADPDGNRLPLEIQGQFRAVPGVESKYGEPGIIPLAVPIYGLPFERPGDYSFVLWLDGRELARYPFHVIQVFGPPQITQPPMP